MNVANMIVPTESPRRLTRWINVLPVWAWAFLAHEFLIVLAFIVPYPYAPSAYVTSHQSFSPLAHFWFQWDSLWFIAIGHYGYAHLPGVPRLSGTAFFPWLPLLIHVVGVWGAWGLTQIAFAVALWLAHRVFRRLSLTGSQAALATMLLALNPAAVYFSTLYAEPWTMLFTLISVELGYRQRWGLAAIAGFLTATTQATGILVGLFPLVGFIGLVTLKKWQDALGPLVWGIGCFLGIASYGVYLGIVFHHPLLFASTQHSRFWNTAWTWPWEQWWQGLRFAVIPNSVVPVRVALWIAITLGILGAIMLGNVERSSQRQSVAVVLYGIVGLGVSLAFAQPGWPPMLSG
jgi:Gpi18-like mannosyltransferase